MKAIEELTFSFPWSIHMAIKVWPVYSDAVALLLPVRAV